MTDLDAFEAERAEVDAMPFGDDWKQALYFAQRSLWLAAPTLIAEHRALLARVAELEAEVEKRRKYTPEEIEMFQKAVERGVWTVPHNISDYTRSQLVEQVRSALEPVLRFTARAALEPKP